MKKLSVFISLIFLLLSTSILAQTRVMPNDYGGNYTQHQINYFISTMPDSLVLKANLDSPTFTGPIQLASTQVGENVFSTTAETDTVTISGALTTDTYIISGQYTAGVDQQDILQWEAISGKLVVHRMAAGESALKYSWLRIPTP